MRATGFFFSYDDVIYLITARHNTLPTNGQELYSGRVPTNFKVDDFRPEIDIYLKKSDEFDVEHTDLRRVSGVKCTPEIDIIAIPCDFDPEKHGYIIWEEGEISPAEKSTEIVESIGFDGASFPDPDREYDTSIYCNEIGRPTTLQLENDMLEVTNPSKFGLMATGSDVEFIGNDEDYNGLSGAPILGDGLVGIHLLNMDLLPEELNHHNVDEFMPIIYSRADILPELLSK